MMKSAEQPGTQYASSINRNSKLQAILPKSTEYNPLTVQTAVERPPDNVESTLTIKKVMSSEAELQILHSTLIDDD